MIDVDKNSSDHPSKNFSKSSDEDSTSPQKELLNSSHIPRSENCEINFIPIEDWLNAEENNLIESKYDTLDLCLIYLLDQSDVWAGDFLNKLKSYLSNVSGLELQDYDSDNSALFHLDAFKSFCSAVLLGFKYGSVGFSSSNLSTRFTNYFENLCIDDKSNSINVSDIIMFEEFMAEMFSIKINGQVAKVRDVNLINTDSLGNPILEEYDIPTNLEYFVGFFLQGVVSSWAYIRNSYNSGLESQL